MGLTILFVMIAEVLIYVPSIANFRLTWLSDRLAAAHTAALVLDAAPSGMVPETLARQILDSIGARAVAMKIGQQRRLLATTDLPTLDPPGRRRAQHLAVRAIVDAFDTLLVSKDTDIMRAVGPAPRGGEFVEIVLDEGPLRRAMWRYSRNILLLSLVISAISAALVYLALHYQFVRPMRRITANMIAFRARSGEFRARHRDVRPAGRDRHRRARARHHAARSSPRCCSRRAGSPRSASRCRRSITTCATCSSSAQLFSDRLAQLADPQVQRFAPKLMRTLERAIAFCQSTLSYGRAQEPPPDRTHDRARAAGRGGARDARY